jgi:hypothetical protein
VTRFYAQPAFWLYFAGWLPYTLHVLVYGLGSPWWRSEIGRAFFLSKLALCLVFSLVLTVFLFGQYDGLPAVRAVLLGLVACAAWYQLSVTVRVQRRPHLDEASHRRRSTDV